MFVLLLDLVVSLSISDSLSLAGSLSGVFLCLSVDGWAGAYTRTQDALARSLALFLALALSLSLSRSRSLALALSNPPHPPEQIQELLISLHQLQLSLSAAPASASGVSISNPDLTPAGIYALILRALSAISHWKCLVLRQTSWKCCRPKNVQVPLDPRP
eukprot:3700935-Rhodomonas_salina.1